MPIDYLKARDGSSLEKIPLWVKANEVESQALDQIRKIASLPWVAHMSVMSDVHYGKGATVGSVIAMRGAVSAAAVGVDIGCMDRDTEFLSPNGWKRISDWSGEDVMQFSPPTGTAEFVSPLAYIRKREEYFYHFKHNKGLDQMICPNHKIILYKGYHRSSRDYEIVIADDFVKHHKSLKKGRAGGFLAAFTVKPPDTRSLSIEDLRIQIMVSADGCIRGRGVCEVHLRKKRKIARAKELLDDAGRDYKLYEHKDGTVTYSFCPPQNTKFLSILYTISSDDLSLIVDEIFLWDGHVAEDGQRSFSSASKENADVVQFVLAATGTRAGMYKVTYKDKDWNDTYEVYSTENKFVNMAPDDIHPVEKVQSPDGYSYCFTVPSGFFVARRNNNIFITGNCGMQAAETNLDVHKCHKKAKRLREEIEKCVPVGPHGHDSPVLNSMPLWIKNEADKLMREFKNLTHEIKYTDNGAAKQIGSLGGGNHFIEITYDTNNRVWIMLHSGSRRIGYELADVHISRAAKLEHNQALEDRSLAVFLSGTPEMDAYRRDLQWAQRYAWLNRAVMMELIKEAVGRVFPSLQIGTEVSCHHNYLEEEVHLGENLFVTRKGAIRAGDGDLGIIPGAKGSKSYIVKGKGNKESLESAPHGAGRKMSRRKAKEKYTVKDLEEATKNTECRKDQGVLDEIRHAYKDVRKVIENSSDLVEVVAELQPAIVAVKG